MKMKPLSKLLRLLILRREVMGRSQRICRWMRRAPLLHQHRHPPLLFLSLSPPSPQPSSPHSLLLLMSLQSTSLPSRSWELPLFSQLVCPRLLVYLNQRSLVSPKDICVWLLQLGDQRQDSLLAKFTSPTARLT